MFAADYSLDDVEAAFIYHLSEYIQFPTQASSDEFVISVVGRSAVIESLQEIARRKTIGGKKITIHPVDDPEKLQKSQIIVFVGDDLN